MQMDIRTLPTTDQYGPPGYEVDLAEAAGKAFRLIPAMHQLGIISTNPESLGFAMAVTDHDLRKDVADDYQGLVSFVAGWGPDAEQYIANAVRKLRFSARTGLESSDAAFERHLVDHPVSPTSAEGTFEWGDFPYGGAVFSRTKVVGGRGGKHGLHVMNRWLLAAVSGLTQEEDAAVAAIALRFIELRMFDADARSARAWT